jgi:hypothetical protein
MDIGVQSTQYQVEDRSWLLSELGTTPGENPTVVLDISKFTQAQHFANGYIPSGTVLGKVTATGLYGPYLDAASDGTQTAVEILSASVRVTRQDGSLPAKVGGAGVHRGEVDPAKLPFTSSNAAAGGYIDTNGKADLKFINFRAAS